MGPPFATSSAGGAALSVDWKGEFTYDPSGTPCIQALDTGETLEDTFTYQLIDFAATPATSAPATVTILVTGVNDAPTSADSSVPVVEGVPYAFQASDFPFSDIDTTDDAAGLQSVRINTDPGKGSLELSGVPVSAPTLVAVADIPNLTFISPDDNGATTFTFLVSDGDAFNPTPRTMTVNITQVNDEPSFTKGSDPTVNENAGPQTVLGWATGISAGPADEAGQVLTFNVTNNTNASLFAAGPAIDSGTGNLTYTPVADANGFADITIELQDDGGLANGGDDTSGPETFRINVTAVNDPPVANPQTVGATEDVDMPITLTGSDPVETDAITTYTIETLPANGKLYQTPDGTSRGAEITATGTDVTHAGAIVIYVSDSDGNGAGHGNFGFTVTDNGIPAATSAEATVTVDVTPVNDKPTALPSVAGSPQRTWK